MSLDFYLTLTLLSDIGAYWFGDMTVPYPDIHCSIELGMNFRSRWASGVRKSEVLPLLNRFRGDFYGRNVSTTISIGRRCCRGLESLHFVILRNRVLDISVNLRKEGSNVKVQKAPVLFFS